MKNKLFPLLFLFCFFLVGCAEEEEVVLKSESIAKNGIFFEIPMGFLLDEEKSDEKTTLYKSPLKEFSKIIYRQLDNDGSVKTMEASSTLEGIKDEVKEIYMAKCLPEVVWEERTEISGHFVYQYAVSYLIYDAPMLHLHYFVEDGNIIHHIEYIGVEEEGYNTSFSTYLSNIHL